jgi:hypothetical protein
MKVGAVFSNILYISLCRCPVGNLLVFLYMPTAVYGEFYGPHLPPIQSLRRTRGASVWGALKIDARVRGYDLF